MLAASDVLPASLERLVEHVRRSPCVVRLYAFELEMQIFLLWLASRAGLGELAVEANGPALSATWNRKAVLHPTVESALELAELGDPHEQLRLEGGRCELNLRTGVEVPRVPGYTLARRDTAEDFARQALEAAALLRRRHGIETGCLKASESGDGARITPGLSLRDTARLEELARRAFAHGDDHVLEAHLSYGHVSAAGQSLPTALSAHIRGGEVAPGATLQFMSGTSWKGNVLVDEEHLEPFGVPVAAYRRLRRFVADLRRSLAGDSTGLVLAGIDAGVGTVSGRHGAEPMLGVQDLNVSFTGAECLRAFLAKAKRRSESTLAGENNGGGDFGVTRIYRPHPAAEHDAFLRVTQKFCRDGVFADTVAAIPGRWGMVGITGRDPLDALENLSHLQGALAGAGLIDEGLEEETL